MSSDNKSKIQQQLLNNNRFYHPLLRLLPVELNSNGYTTFSFSGDVSFSQFAPPPPPNDPVNNRPRSSAAAGSRFGETITQINDDNQMERICQLCGRAYRNMRHQRQFRENHICCVCRVQFDSAESLIEHVGPTLQSNICCVIDCQMPFGDGERRKIHLNRHSRNPGNC